MFLSSRSQFSVRGSLPAPWAEQELCCWNRAQALRWGQKNPRFLPGPSG